MSEIREEFNQNLLDHNKVPIPSPQPGDMVFSYYNGSPGLVLENLEKNKSKVLWSEYPQFIVESKYDSVVNNFYNQVYLVREKT